MFASEDKSPGSAPVSRSQRRVYLPAAFLVTVNVWDPTGTLPQANVDLDIYDVGTGLKLYTPGVATGDGGNTDADLPPGVYDILATPVRAGPYGAVGLYGLRVTGPSTQDIRLAVGAVLDGTVSDSIGTPLDLVSIDVKDSRTGRLVAARYRAAAGVFSFFLVPGSYDLHFEPPPGTDLRSVDVPAYTVPGAPLGRGTDGVCLDNV